MNPNEIQSIYLAGPMTGLPEFNYPAFHSAAALLRSRGFTVISPAELFSGQLGLPWEAYMRQGLAAMLSCDAIAMLPGWPNSRGACLEQNLAAALGFHQMTVDGDIIRLKGKVIND